MSPCLPFETYYLQFLWGQMGIAWIKMSHTLLARTLGIILSGFFVQLMKQTQYEKRLFSEIWQYVTGRTPGPRFFTLGGTSSFSLSHFRQKRTLALDSLPLRAGGWREKGKAYRNWHVFFLHCYLKCPECQCEVTGVWGPGQGWPSLASFTSLGGARLALTKLLSLFSPRPTD